MKGLFKHFKQFSKIRKIKLSKVNNDDLEDIIDGIGSQIFHMELVCIRGSLDLVPIAAKCSQLKILEIFYSMAVHVSTPVNFIFPKLQKLVIYSTDIHGFDTQQVGFTIVQFHYVKVQ